MSMYAGCDERTVDCHTKHGRSHALQGEATSRHYVSGIPATASPRSPLSPLQIQRSGRDLWRETLRSQRHVRRSNSSLSPRHGHQTKVRSRPAKDDSPVRRSLDSQRTEISRRSYGLGVTEGGGDMGNSAYLASAGEGYPRPMWSDEQLRRARRFSSSHTRGVSCPTLNITRIMRSISVSAGHGGGSSGNGSSRFGPRQTRRETGLPGSSSTCAFVELSRQQRRNNAQLDEITLPLLWFGIAICFDALIYVFSILPAKFVRALLQLSVAILFELPIFIEQACMSSYVQAAIGALPEAWAQRLVLIGRRAQRLVGQLSGRLDQGATLGGNVVRWLSPTQLFDFYRGLLLIATCAILCHMDAAQMYHSIRAQSSLKLYFIFSALDIFDRLLSSFGHDVMDALQSTVTDPRSQRWKSGAAYFALAQVYMLVHTLVLFYQVITLNVAVNAYSDQLLALLISNQFVEIKSNVFKKWEKEMLFQVVCADVVERFQEIVFLFIIILRNLAELAGPALSPSTGAAVPTAQAPVSFDSATPSAFGPLLPSWISIPLLNRILTPVLMVLGTEILIDWIKHAFITKLNWIRPEIYSHYIDILSRDLACSKAGVRARGIPPPAVSSFGEDIPMTTGTKDDEKIGAQELHSGASDNEQHQSVHGSLTMNSPRSSSLLIHAALKVFAWAKANIFAESREIPATAADQTLASTPAKRRRGHQRSQSVTQPQLFVEQSTRVARRLGLSPMPLA
ncbi:hypothetical protein GGI14_001530, partial [Coemansia sp. S680]